ncbi:glycine cleavage system protein GcvH [Spongiactinospora sp. TRM90649]|uniref:glycine cleavage system protein GcvH n=1 Tax=Spongiactinospora sp. TRM90649 TaxID=3031114 RepID=UPI0023F66395|nr:glycine cleavage system protein GcvH [Spongiactinospora sp. TRM90649]MDF5752633.1 glycine cleavage system protein GcvH [Spongiactinospora sp. TRM90649]
MSEVPEELQYTKEHEWVSGLEDGDLVTIGVTAFAAGQLGDVVYVQMPEVGANVTAGESVGEVESTKSVNDIFSPVTGQITAVNDVVSDDPSLVNSDPYGDGWLFQVRADGDTSELLTAAEYTALTSGDS